MNITFPELTEEHLNKFITVRGYSGVMTRFNLKTGSLTIYRGALSKDFYDYKLVRKLHKNSVITLW